MYDIYRDSGINRVREYNDGNTIAQSVKNCTLQVNNNREFNEKNTRLIFPKIFK